MPKSTPATKTSPRQRLLAAADELFYNEGIHQVGIDRVIEKAGVAKGSLYYNFSGKDDLISQYLLGRHAAWSARIDAGIDDAPTPTDKILAIFDVLGELFTDPGYRGCSFMNAVAEATDDGPEIKAAANFRLWLHTLFGSLVAQLDATEPDETTNQLVILYDGAVSAAQMDKAPQAAVTAKHLAAMVLASAGQRSVGS